MQKKVLVIGSVWPEPKSSAAGSRMLQLLSVFQKGGFSITFVSSCVKTENAVNLEELHIKTTTVELNNSSFDAFIKELQPDIVVFDRFMMEEQYGWRVAEIVPSAIRILDTEDLHCLRKGRGEALKTNEVFSKKHLFNDVAKREIASIYRCDITLIISEYEMELLQDTFKVPAMLLYYLPFLVFVDKKQMQALPMYSDRKDFVTIGSFLHEPNYDAVLYLKKHIWPLLRKQVPNASLYIYGSYESQKVTQLTNKAERFYIKGFAEDAGEVMQNARVCLASLRFGAGLKGKLMDAMQYRTPCVMTSIASEGIFAALPPNGFIADDVNKFVEKATSLYLNEGIWNDSVQHGEEVLRKRFDYHLFADEFLSSIETLGKELSAHRLENFTGSMLAHHTMRSTMYMSKWIEAKNSLQ
ncbi:glycosyl transferase [Neptunitalea chrysea]|uniref:Glycosyl transferase n=1 Tax=Neptunitalea chrysea TaxID=1647581 RepID=A0A9W6EVF3_9FLAO|nr:glycosyltransferase [Neptunitalea chrysea]GLB53749.1 glycosyl transferase [Neptunitalea chrysea]